MVSIKERIRRIDAFFSDDYNALPILLIGAFLGVIAAGVCTVAFIAWWLGS